MENLEKQIHEATAAAYDLQKEKPSRELSLAITKLEEAFLWLSVAKKKYKT